MLPPSVPKLRINGEATLTAACVSKGKLCCRSLFSMISLNVVVAPMCAPSEPMLIPLRSGIVVRSTTWTGRGMPLPVTQSFITPPIRSLPPPSALLVAPNLSSRPTASWTVVGSYSSKVFITLAPLASGALQAREDLLASDRHVSDPHANGVVDGVGDRRRRRGHRRLADPVRAEHAVLLRVLDQDHSDVPGCVLDAQGLVVQHVGVQRQTGRRVRQQLLGQRGAQRHDHAAFDLLFERKRVDRAANVVRRNVLQDVDGSGDRIHFDLSGVSRPRGALPGWILRVDRPPEDRPARELNYLRKRLLLVRVALQDEGAVLQIHVVGLDVDGLALLSGVVDELLRAP